MINSDGTALLPGNFLEIVFIVFSGNFETERNGNRRIGNYVVGSCSAI